jgi:hypothetical protein
MVSAIAIAKRSRMRAQTFRDRDAANISEQAVSDGLASMMLGYLKH